MENQLLIANLNRELALELPENDCQDAVKEKLYSYIHHLIDKDFEKLVLILYRMDVHEDKLKKLLNDFPGTDAAVIIGNLIIERQLQKIQNRQSFCQYADNISEDEKW